SRAVAADASLGLPIATASARVSPERAAHPCTSLRRVLRSPASSDLRGKVSVSGRRVWGARGREFKSPRPDHSQRLLSTAEQAVTRTRSCARFGLGAKVFGVHAPRTDQGASRHVEGCPSAAGFAPRSRLREGPHRGEPLAI